MKIFLSHEGRDKSTVREFRNHFPRFLETWLDENDILFGESLAGSLRKAIKEETDFVLVFIARTTLKRPWVRKELKWAFDRERTLARTFVLPVLIEKIAESDLLEHIGDRVYIRIASMESADIRSAAEKVVAHLFGLIVRSIDPRIQGRLTGQNELEERLHRIGENCSNALGRFTTRSRKHAFVEKHVEALLRSLIEDTGRLSNGDVVTDYDDISLLTAFVDSLGGGDELLGLTDWGQDHHWWRGADAAAFLDANKRAVGRGARVRRVFVYGEGDIRSPDREKVLLEEIANHQRLGVEVYEAKRELLPSRLPTLSSQCVLSHQSKEDSRQLVSWLTYRVHLDRTGYPMKNIFCLRDEEIQENLGVLSSILLSPATTRRCTEQCGATALTVEGDGRRLYIHRASFDFLAKTGVRPAELVYRALAAVPVAKLAYHDLQEAVVLGHLRKGLADALCHAISERWVVTQLTEMLRSVAQYRHRSGDRSRGALLSDDEKIVATCYDSDYYTFATSEAAARRMYSDVIRIRDVRRRRHQDDPDYRDLELISGGSLVFLRSRDEGGEEGMTSLSDAALLEVKGRIAADFAADLDEVAGSIITEAAASEAEVIQVFRDKCVERVRRLVLSFPGEGEGRS